MAFDLDFVSFSLSLQFICIHRLTDSVFHCWLYVENVSVRQNELQQMKNAFQIEVDEWNEEMLKKIYNNWLFSMIVLHRSVERVIFFAIFFFFSPCNAWEIERTNGKHIYKSISLFRFIWLRSIRSVSFAFLILFHQIFLQLNWFDAFTFPVEKVFNLLLNGWPLMLHLIYSIPRLAFSRLAHRMASAHKNLFVPFR